MREQLLGVSWQRCRVHLTRNAQDLVPRCAEHGGASAIRMVFEQPHGQAAHEQLDRGHHRRGAAGRQETVLALLNGSLLHRSGHDALVAAMRERHAE